MLERNEFVSLAWLYCILSLAAVSSPFFWFGSVLQAVPEWRVCLFLVELETYFSTWCIGELATLRWQYGHSSTTAFAISVIFPYKTKVPYIVRIVSFKIFKCVCVYLKCFN